MRAFLLCGGSGGMLQVPLGPNLMDTTWVLLAFCLGASSSRWINDINLWVVAAPTGNRFIDFLAGFLKSEPDIARERENGGALHGGPTLPAPCRRGFRRSSPLSR